MMIDDIINDIKKNEDNIEDCFLVFSIHGNMVLRGMCESMMGLLISIMRGWLPEDAVENSLRPDIIMINFPMIPTSTTLFIEGRYDKFENKFRVSLYPRNKIDLNLNPQKNKSNKKLLNNNESANAKRKKRKPDWNCEKCHKMNFGKRVTCFHCNEPLQEDFKTSKDDDIDKNIDKHVEDNQMNEDTEKDITTNKEEEEEEEEEEESMNGGGWSGIQETDDIENLQLHRSNFRHEVLKTLISKELHVQQFTHWINEMESKANEMKISYEQSCVNLAPIAPKDYDIVNDNGGGGGKDKRLKKKKKELSAVDTENESSSLITENQKNENSLKQQQQQLSLLTVITPSSDIKYKVYHKTLHLLRQADASGLWPASSPTRARVIASPQAGPSNQNGSGGGGGSSGVVGGTFALGSQPPPLEPPKGNTLFKDLLIACFELESLLLPNRIPSSTIAVNRHAQFTPHVDTGNGAGQSVSLIVALGDFIGGEIMIEGKSHDIRYEPIEFNGWTQRHWTNPFQGERYSLVWFTPLGCEQMSGLSMFKQDKE